MLVYITSQGLEKKDALSFDITINMPALLSVHATVKSLQVTKAYRSRI